MNEKGCSFCLHKNPSVYAKHQPKRVHSASKELGKSITVVGCGNAVGTVIVSKIIFKEIQMKP